MIAATDLFDLIHSLSKNEKRYITLSMQEKGGKNYLKLFKAIDEQDRFNEAELKLILSKEKFIKHFAFAKHYLHESILRKLNSFHYSSSVESLLYQSLLETDLLYRRGLFSQAMKKLVKIKKLAEEKEEFEILLQCIKREKKIVRRTQKNTNQKIWQQFLQQEISLTRCIDDVHRYEELADKLNTYFLTSGEYLVNKSQKEKIKPFLSNPLLSANLKIFLSKTSKLHYYFTRALCFNFLQEYPQSLECIDIMLSVFDSSSYADEQSVILYLNALNNKVFLLEKMKNYPGALKTLEQISTMINGSWKGQHLPDSLKGRHLIVSSVHYTNIQINSGLYKKALESIPLTENILGKYPHAAGDDFLFIFNYQSAYLHFIFGNYRQALTSLNKILNQKIEKVLVREDVYCAARILYMLTNYEMYKENLTEYLVKSTYNFLVKRKRLSKIENVFLNFIKNKLFKNLQPAQMLHELKTVKEEITKLKDNVFEKNIMESLDYISWVESKIIRKPFIDVLRGKHSRL